MPGTGLGQRLLGHELTHVVQQAQAPTGAPVQIGSIGDQYEQEADQVADKLIGGGAQSERLSGTGPRLTRSATRLQRLGANPGCTPAERGTIHQAIFNARGWMNKAITQLNTSPLPRSVTASLLRNFGPTYGVAANVPLILGRIRVGYNTLSISPIGCAGAADATCAAGHCGYANAGSHQATICSNPTLAAGVDWRFQAGCVLHEALHASFSGFTVDEYSGWHGASGSTPTYPGTGTDPLLNADSYTTLVMDLS